MNIKIAKTQDQDILQGDGDRSWTEHQRQNHRMYDAIIDGKKVGDIVTVPSRKEDSTDIWISSLFVYPEWRGRGIGRELVEHVLEENAGKTIWLIPNPYEDKPLSKEKLAEFYRSCGFERTEDPIGKDRLTMKKQKKPR